MENAEAAEDNNNSSSSAMMDDKLMVSSDSEKYDGRILNFDVLQSTEKLACCGGESVSMLTSTTNEGDGGGADVGVDCVKSSLVETTTTGTGSISVPQPVPVVVGEISGTDSRPDTPRSAASSITTTTTGKKNKKKRIRHRRKNTNRSENSQSDNTNTGTESEIGDYDEQAGAAELMVAMALEVDEVLPTVQEVRSVLENNDDNEADAAATFEGKNESEGVLIEGLVEEVQEREGERKRDDNESASTEVFDEVLERTPSTVNVDGAIIGPASNEVFNYF
jgi:hypothetical protein